jgi:hypothetical protein
MHRSTQEDSYKIDFAFSEFSTNFRSFNKISWNLIQRWNFGNWKKENSSGPLPGSQPRYAGPTQRGKLTSQPKPAAPRGHDRCSWPTASRSMRSMGGASPRCGLAGRHGIGAGNSPLGWHNGEGWTGVIGVVFTGGGVLRRSCGSLRRVLWQEAEEGEVRGKIPWPEKLRRRPRFWRGGASPVIDDGWNVKGGEGEVLHRLWRMEMDAREGGLLSGALPKQWEEGE